MKGNWKIQSLAAAAVTVAALFATPFAGAAEKKLTVWSHFADHEGARAFFRDVEKILETENPDIDLEMTFYEKKALFAAEMTALRAGAGPDIIYLEPDRIQFIESGFVTPINDLVELDRLHDFAKDAWTVDGKIYALGMQAFTVEFYYGKKLMDKVLKEAGIALPSSYRFNQSQFLDVVKKASEMGITAVVQGIGDRHAGAYPKTFTTLKLGESHYYFHTKPGGLTFPLGSWYSSRAFNIPDKGGQPDDFQLGIMQFPAMDGGACPDCKTIGVAGSYAISANSKQPEVAAKFLNVLAREDMGRKWIQNTFVQTGVKIGAGGGFTGKYANYFKEMAERGEGRTYFLGTPIDFIRGKCKETFVQVINAAFPAGLIGPDQALDMMEGACYQG
jgi:multiple sugar transport system substrate-binding protein